MQCRFIHAADTEQPPFSCRCVMPIGEGSVHGGLFAHDEQYAIRIVLRRIDQHQICRFRGDGQRHAAVYMADVFLLFLRRGYLRLADCMWWFLAAFFTAGCKRDNQTQGKRNA